MDRPIDMVKLANSLLGVRGQDLGYGFNSFEEAYLTIDPKNPPVGEVFKIGGQYYKLKVTYYLKQKLSFEEIKQ